MDNGGMRRKAASNGTAPSSAPTSNGGERSRGGAARPSLIERSEIPAHLQFNKYVLRHYRSPSDWRGCLHSLFYLHNETVNIVTHGLPVIAILVSLPTVLPWREIDVPYLPYIHVVACISPWIGSTLYHLFMNLAHGERVYKRLLMGDMFGIWIAQTWGSLTPVCSTFYCYDVLYQQVMIAAFVSACSFSFYKALTAKTPWERRFSFIAPFVFRVLIVTLRLQGWGGGMEGSVYYLISQDIFAISGGIIGATNIPERWFPGTLDLIANSHHFMHVMVLLAAYQMHKAVSMDLVWMTMVKQNGALC